MSSYSRAVTACWKSGRSDEGKQLLEDGKGYNSCEEFTRLPETRLPQTTLNYIKLV